MRVCPKCRYEDPIYWRHSRFSYWLDQTEYENFETMHPELCPLKPTQMVEDELYVYRRMGDRVERKAIIDYEVYGWREHMEKANHDIHDFRKHWERLPKLTEFFESENMTNTDREGK